ncbi:hypothetical protein, unlikely [Trypanosoma congolense IL3000]|uniref:Uncharacterized protein n=1 Tax=Trypanosoma congolense (strain IL3000) TaxID=1068625 RepID=F9W9V0_TRYCI|nr:hypothetical protein, unlikely [Trypanosoma congolense IL3000]
MRVPGTIFVMPSGPLAHQGDQMPDEWLTGGTPGVVCRGNAQASMKNPGSFYGSRIAGFTRCASRYAHNYLVGRGETSRRVWKCTLGWHCTHLRLQIPFKREWERRAHPFLKSRAATSSAIPFAVLEPVCFARSWPG